MIRIKVQPVEGGKPMIVIGLSGENVTRLVAGEPIYADLEDMGIPDLKIALTYGVTEEAIAREWEEAGILPEGTADRAAQMKPGESVRQVP